MDKREALEIVQEIEMWLDEKEWDALNIAFDALRHEIEREESEDKA